jgi:hypothetical protein
MPAMSDPAALADRQARIDALLALLRTQSEATLRKIAELLVDTPDDQFFNQMEFALRDLAHDLVSDAQQAALKGGKKRATKAPASSAETATPTPASSATDPTTLSP